MQPDNIRDWVLLYHNKGFSVIPLKEHDKIPNIPSWSEYSQRRPTIEEIEKWFNDGLFGNIGVICGEVSGDLVVIDIDDKSVIQELNLSLEQVFNEGGLVVETNKGYHIYIQNNNNPGEPTRDDNLHIEYRSNGNYVVAPPSIHPSGKQYSFMFFNENNPLTMKIKDARIIFDKWVQTLRESRGVESKPEKEIVAIKKGVNYGERNVSAFKLACDYKNRGLSIGETTKLMLEWNRNCRPPLYDRELLSCIKSAYKKFIPDDTEIIEKNKHDLLEKYEVFEKDDDGEPTGKINCCNMGKLILEGDSNFYLVTNDNQEIYVYNGSYYEPDGEAFAKERTQYYLNGIVTCLENIKKEVTGIIRNHKYIEREKLNPPLNLLNFKNGIYDIKTKKFIPHSPEYYFTNELPVKYNPEAKCPKWLKFIEDVTYEEDRPFIQELAGYLLYRKYLWALLVILLGHGRNGKSTLINVLRTVLGNKNVSDVSLHILSYNRFAGAKLYKKFANLCSDLGEHDIKNTGLLKQLTGRDTIFAEEKHKPGFDFENFAKLVFACNILPEIKDNTLAMTERLAVIEFPNEFIKGSEECDPNIYDKLTTDDELSGILNWMVKGLDRLLLNNNFSQYRDFKNVTEYKKQCQDPVYLFIDEYLESEPENVHFKSEVYIKYKEFCGKEHFPVLNDVWFSRKLKQYLPVDWHIEEGQKEKTTWKGLKIRDIPVEPKTYVDKEEKEERLQKRLQEEEDNE